MESRERILAGGHENVLELDSGDVCTTLGILLATESYTLRLLDGQMFYIYTHDANKNKSNERDKKKERFQMNNYRKPR